jgi:hypothetical protein
MEYHKKGIMKMKIIVAVVGLVLLVMLANPEKVKAQTIPQLIEQLVMDKEKLAELKTILQDMYKSYQIINRGYTDIKNIVQDNFNLHKAYLDGLLAVSPTVRNYSRVAGIINTEASIVSEYKAAYNRAVAGGHFTAGELSYMSNVYARVFARSLNCLDELTMVVTAGELRMSDADRLQAIDGIYTDITGQLSLLRNFSNGSSIQDMQRVREAGDIGTLKTIYGIN